MTKIDLKIKIASPTAVKFYICGNLVFPKRFSYPTKDSISFLKSKTTGYDSKTFKALLGGNNLDVLKQDIFNGSLSARTKKLRRILQGVEINIKYLKASKLVAKLLKLWDKNKLAVSLYISHFTHRKNANYNAYVVPGIGEAANVANNVLIIGDGSSADVAFGILLEELLHATLTLPAKNILGMGNINDRLFSEAYIGAHLYQLLKELNFKKGIIDSLVFGWSGGERRSLVKKILFHQIRLRRGKA